jgi:hypothetical protein
MKQASQNHRPNKIFHEHEIEVRFGFGALNAHCNSSHFLTITDANADLRKARNGIFRLHCLQAGWPQHEPKVARGT